MNINIKWLLITLLLYVAIVFGLILICRFIDRKFMKKEKNVMKIDGKVITGRRMSDGEPITGFVVGTTPFTYILPENEVRKACCTGEQQVKIEITAERILAHD